MRLFSQIEFITRFQIRSFSKRITESYVIQKNHLNNDRNTDWVTSNTISLTGFDKSSSTLYTLQSTIYMVLFDQRPNIMLGNRMCMSHTQTHTHFDSFWVYVISDGRCWATNLSSTVVLYLYTYTIHHSTATEQPSEHSENLNLNIIHINWLLIKFILYFIGQDRVNVSTNIKTTYFLCAFFSLI